MSKRTRVVEFYSKLLDIINDENEELPQEMRVSALNLYGQVKTSVSLAEFTDEQINELHADENVHGKYAQRAFVDLAPHLRSPKARAVLHHFLMLADLPMTSESQPVEEMYIHVTKAWYLGEESGAAVVTMIVDDYESFQELLSESGEGKPIRPRRIHGSFTKAASDVTSPMPNFQW